jgi:small subunit ribosomal protein S1
MFKEQEAKNLKETKKRLDSQAEESKTTLGDANAQLQALKDKMESNE